MNMDEPYVLPVGTEVSAKYRGAFCEAKVKKVVKCVKCKVTLKENHVTITVLDDEVVKGCFKHGATVEVRHPDTSLPAEGVMGRIMDQSMYTVVFDDGDENTLRRSQLCLKGEKHFVKSDTLDELPLTHPEHFGTPVMRGAKGSRRKRPMASSDSESDAESSSDEPIKRVYRGRLQDLIGRILCMEVEDRKKTTWVPVLVVQPSADVTDLKTRDHLLVRSFRDSKFYGVAKRDTKEFSRESAVKNEDKILKAAYEKAVLYYDTRELPQNWDREDLLGTDSDDNDDETSDDEQSEDKDRFVAQLFKFMDDRGTPINKAPLVANRDLDLYKLFRLVQNHGGYNKVTNQVKWRMVYSKLNLPPSASASNQIKAAYKKYLHAFEDFYRKLGSTMGTITRPRNRHSSGRSLLSFREREREPTPKSPRSSGGPSDMLNDRDDKEIMKTPEKVSPPQDSDHSETESVASSSKKEPKATRSRAAETERKLAVRDDAESETDSIKSRKEDKKSTAVKESPGRPTTREDMSRVGRDVSKEREDLAKRTLRDDPVRATPRREDDKKKRDLPSVSREREKVVKEEREAPERDDKEEGRQPKKRGRKKGAGEEEEVAVEKPKKVVEPADKKVREDGAGDKGTPIVGRRRMREDSSRNKDDTASEVSEKTVDSDKELDDVVVNVRENTYAIGTKLKIKYGKGKNIKPYEAKVVEFEQDGGSLRYKVHYTGWNIRYDEWIRKDRIMGIVDENSAKKCVNSTANMPQGNRPPTKVLNTKPKNGGTPILAQLKKRLVRPIPIGLKSPVHPTTTTTTTTTTATTTATTTSATKDKPNIQNVESRPVKPKLAMPPLTAVPPPPKPAEPTSATTPKTKSKKPRPTRSTSVEGTLSLGLPVKRHPRDTSADQTSHVSSDESDDSDADSEAKGPTAKPIKKETTTISKPLATRASRSRFPPKKTDLDESFDSHSDSSDKEEVDKKVEPEPKTSCKSPRSDDSLSGDVLKRQTEVKLEILPENKLSPKKLDPVSGSPQKQSMPNELKVDLWDCTKSDAKSGVTDAAKPVKDETDPKAKIYDFEDSSSQDSFGDVAASAAKLATLKRKELVKRKRKLSTDSRVSEDSVAKLATPVSTAEKTVEDIFDKGDIEPSPAKMTRQMVPVPEFIGKELKDEPLSTKKAGVKDSKIKERPTPGKPKPKAVKQDGEKVEKVKGKRGPKPMLDKPKIKRKFVGSDESKAEGKMDDVPKKKVRRKKDQKEEKDVQKEEVNLREADSVKLCDIPVIHEPADAIPDEPVSSPQLLQAEEKEAVKPVDLPTVPEDPPPWSPTSLLSAPTLLETLAIETKQDREDSDEPAPQLSPIPGTSAAALVENNPKPVELAVRSPEQVSPQPDVEEPMQVHSAPESPVANLVLDNTPPDTPEGSISAMPTSAEMTPNREEGSTTKSEQEANLEVETFMSLSASVPPPGAESPNACDTSTISNGSGGSSGNAPGSESEGPFTGTKAKEGEEEEEEEEEGEEEKTPPKRRRRGHKRGPEKGSIKKHTPKHNVSDSDDAEASKVAAAAAERLSPVKPGPISQTEQPCRPRQCKYNFLDLEGGKYLEGEDRIRFLMGKITDLRKIYMQLKAEVAGIDRRRKRHRRKEREAAAAAAAAAATTLGAQALTELMGS